jgi:hypothetical protein
MDYVQVLENRICRMRQSFFQLISHVTKTEITRRQPDLTHELQNIVRDFLSASQITEPFDESQRHGHTYHDHLGGDSNLEGPVVFPNIGTPCITKLAVPATVPIEPPIPTFAPPLGPPPPFFETKATVPRNFAQRLYFSCIKRAHDLLTNPHADGTEVARVFRYSFHYSDANTMTSTFEVLLRTDADYQTAYVYSFGGAGTHYKNSQTDLGMIQYVQSGQGTSFKCDGDTWFDPRDIEGWLEENGLVIGGAQSFIYLSESPSFEPCRNMTLYPEGQPPRFSKRESRQCAKILNVDRFLQELLSRGVCLGCAPGFRRLDVEAAFSLAISDDTTYLSEP